MVKSQSPLIDGVCPETDSSELVQIRVCAGEVICPCAGVPIMLVVLQNQRLWQGVSI